jgi:hypothetical protein
MSGLKFAKAHCAAAAAAAQQKNVREIDKLDHIGIGRADDDCLKKVRCNKGC